MRNGSVGMSYYCRVCWHAVHPKCHFWMNYDQPLSWFWQNVKYFCKRIRLWNVHEGFVECRQCREDKCRRKCVQWPYSISHETVNAVPKENFQIVFFFLLAWSDTNIVWISNRRQIKWHTHTHSQTLTFQIHFTLEVLSMVKSCTTMTVKSLNRTDSSQWKRESRTVDFNKNRNGCDKSDKRVLPNYYLIAFNLSNQLLDVQSKSLWPF